MTKYFHKRPKPIDTRMADFFRANPDEELTMEDVEAKFGITKRRVQNYRREIAATGIEYVKVFRLRSSR